MWYRCLLAQSVECLFSYSTFSGATPRSNNSPGSSLRKLVIAPLIKECLASIECKAVDLIEKHNIVVLQAVTAFEAAP